MSTSKIILFIISLAIFLRLIFVWQFVDVKNINQWEYGEIAKNIVHNNGYSLFYFENDSLNYKYKEGKKPFPSAYMPPGYVLVILPFYIFKNDFLINLFVITLHIIFSALVIIYLFRLCEKYFSIKVAVISSIIYAILPEFIYSCISFSPTVLFHLLILLIIDRQLIMLKKNQFDIMLPILLSIVIYLRAEFSLFVFFIILTLIFSRQFKLAFINSILILLFIFPWSIRNSIEFNKTIPFNTNFGQNLYRGNNPSDVGWWGEEIMLDKIKELPRDKSFEAHLNELYFNRAIKYIKENPLKFITNGIRKQFELWFFNLNDRRAKILIYLIPAILILILFIIGIVKSYSLSKYNLFYLFFLQATVIATIFFALPRYQTMMKVLMLPFVAIGIIFLFNTFKKGILTKKL